MTGTHPEYHSTAMWDAMKAWIDRGGRLMYMGGNGWYWRVAFHDELPGVIEVRRAEDGIRTWDRRARRILPFLQRRIWRLVAAHRPRAQCRCAGVGFIAQGFDFSSYYRRGARCGRSARRLHLRGRARRDHRRFRSDRRRRRRHRARLHHDRAGFAAQHAAPRLLGRTFAPDAAGERGVRCRCRPISAAIRTTASAPTSPSARRRRAAPSSPHRRSPGAARSRTTTMTTTSRA